MPTPRSEMSAGILADKIYVPGGLGGLRSFEVYDLVRNRWEPRAKLPAGRHHHMTATYENKVYVFGGGDENWRPTRTAWVYLPTTNRWRHLAAMPEPRYAGSAVVHDHHIYLVAGEGPTGRLLRYDPKVDRWLALAPTDQRREHTGAVVFEGKIVVIGGRYRGYGELNSTEIYDIDNNRWVGGPALKTARGGHAAVVYKGSIRVFGGEVIMTGNKKTLKDSERLENLSGRWQRGRGLPLALHGMPIVSTNASLYILGGSERAGAIVNRGHVYRYDE